MQNDTFQTRLISIQRNLLNYAYTLTSNRDDAYDLLQDTTLKALDNKDKYVDNVNFKGWMFTIMRNLFINNYRKSMRTSVVVDSSDDLYMLNLSQDSGMETPEGAMSVKEIHGMLAEIAHDLRKPFSMFLAGYKYVEIAESLGEPLGTVKSRIFQARRRLQKALGRYRYD
ncbi:MAG: RNA polymerase sigma factor [Muribaculaceae bacterium]|nr:RNA polymerase sigma factor [Muribaculaceae bacterium]